MIGRGGKQDLTLSQQLLFLRANPATDGDGAVRTNALAWHMSVQPTPLARTYQASIQYVPGKCLLSASTSPIWNSSPKIATSHMCTTIRCDCASTCPEPVSGLRQSGSIKRSSHGHIFGCITLRTGWRQMIGKVAASILAMNHMILATARCGARLQGERPRHGQPVDDQFFKAAAAGMWVLEPYRQITYSVTSLHRGWRAVIYRLAQQVKTNPANLIRAQWILVCLAHTQISVCSLILRICRILPMGPWFKLDLPSAFEERADDNTLRHATWRNARC